MRLVGEIQVDVYELSPAPTSRWLVVRQTNGEEMNYRWFVRERDEFVEKQEWEVPVQLRTEVVGRFPQLREPMLYAA
jgi:hypothetical protein